MDKLFHHNKSTRPVSTKESETLATQLHSCLIKAGIGLSRKTSLTEWSRVLRLLSESEDNFPPVFDWFCNVYSTDPKLKAMVQSARALRAKWDDVVWMYKHAHNQTKQWDLPSYRTIHPHLPEKLMCQARREVQGLTTSKEELIYAAWEYLEFCGDIIEAAEQYRENLKKENKFQVFFDVVTPALIDVFERSYTIPFIKNLKSKVSWSGWNGSLGGSVHNISYKNPQPMVAELQAMLRSTRAGQENPYIADAVVNAVIRRTINNENQRNQQESKTRSDRSGGDDK